MWVVTDWMPRYVYLEDESGYEECSIADYGTRRRYSRQWHAELLPLLAQGLGSNFVGTSNVYFAKQYGYTPLGTMAHSIYRHFRHWDRACVIPRWQGWKPGRVSTAAI